MCRCHTLLWLPEHGSDIAECGRGRVLWQIDVCASADLFAGVCSVSRVLRVELGRLLEGRATFWEVQPEDWLRSSLITRHRRVSLITQHRGSSLRRGCPLGRREQQEHGTRESRNFALPFSARACSRVDWGLSGAPAVLARDQTKHAPSSVSVVQQHGLAYVFVASTALMIQSEPPYRSTNSRFAVYAISSLDTEGSLRHRTQNRMKLRRDSTISCRALFVLLLLKHESTKTARSIWNRRAASQPQRGRRRRRLHRRLWLQRRRQPWNLRSWQWRLWQWGRRHQNQRSV